MLRICKLFCGRVRILLAFFPTVSQETFIFVPRKANVCWSSGKNSTVNMARLSSLAFNNKYY